jgi:predicted component of type VI protein secretion system
MQTLAILNGLTAGTVFVLGEETHSVGRAEENQIVLDDQDVSRHHSLLIRDGVSYRVRDLNSANGTWVNDQRVTEAVLRHNDRVRMGLVEMRFESVAGKSDAAARPAGVPAPNTLRAPAHGSRPDAEAESASDAGSARIGTSGRDAGAGQTGFGTLGACLGTRGPARVALALGGGDDSCLLGCGRGIALVVGGLAPAEGIVPAN